MQANDWWRPFRAAIPVLREYAYLNSGTCGPIPEVSAKALTDEIAYEVAHGRGNFSTFARIMGLLSGTRESLARLLGAGPESIALTHHTSDGLNIVAWGLDWEPGDNVVTTTLEHDAVTVSLGVLRERRGPELRCADIGYGERALAGLRETIDTRTRLVVISHVVYSTGALMPVADIAALCRERGARLLVDGAQSAGAMPVDVSALGADYYTVSGQKWVLGPEGTGGLYVRPGRLQELQPTFAGYFSAAKHDFRGNNVIQSDARRFETSLHFRPGLAALRASIEWLLDEVGLERAWERSLALARECRRRLEEIDSVEILTPADCDSHLLTFLLRGFSPARHHSLAAALGLEGLVIRSTDCSPCGLRAGFGFFNDDSDIESLVSAIRSALQAGPEVVELTAYARARLSDEAL